MKKIACVFFEVEDNETVEEIVAKLEKSNKKVKSISTSEVDKTEPWRVKLKEILNSLGENISAMGYSAMFDIMEFVEKNPEYKKHFLMKELYAYVTQKTGKSYHQIERNIRAMVERIYSHNSVEFVNKVLGISTNSYVKMNNANFVALIIERLF